MKLAKRSFRQKIKMAQKKVRTLTLIVGFGSSIVLGVGFLYATDELEKYNLEMQEGIANEFADNHNVDLSNVYVIDKNVAINKINDSTFVKIADVNEEQKHSINFLRDKANRNMLAGCVQFLGLFMIIVIGGWQTARIGNKIETNIALKRAIVNAKKTVKIDNKTYDMHITLEELDNKNHKLRKYEAIFETEKELKKISEKQFAYFVEHFELLKKKGKFTVFSDEDIYKLGLKRMDIMDNAKEIIAR
ncbi:MAG: hypothetical protein FWE47_00530 [Oscillospiraceae bacterium]|nr:hypothetical protein [Oscillospiraceae bacterium]